jgi:hypothetical protein
VTHPIPVTGPLLGLSYTLSSGVRVRLRVARPCDAEGIARLVGPRELDVARLLRFDPRRRLVVCASALVGSVETILGVGAIDLDSQEPDLLVVEDHEGLEELLSAALAGCAAAHTRAGAA